MPQTGESMDKDTFITRTDHNVVSYIASGSRSIWIICLVQTLLTVSFLTIGVFPLNHAFFKRSFALRLVFATVVVFLYTIRLCFRNDVAFRHIMALKPFYHRPPGSNRMESRTTFDDLERSVSHIHIKTYLIGCITNIRRDWYK